MRRSWIAWLALALVGCGDDGAAPCGNRVLEASEQCDDGNTEDGDGCQADCTLPSCGDGVVDLYESCDAGDANAAVADAPCRPDCRLPSCGDGVVDAALGEQCDDGALVRGDGCAETCLLEACRNGVLDPGEQCDDGNALSNDGCSSDCVIEQPTWAPFVRHATIQPSASVGVGSILVTDAARGRVLAFSAAGAWILDAAGWSGGALGGPTHLPLGACASHVARGEIVCFGGRRGSSIDNTVRDSDETWIWNDGWRAADPAVRPPRRAQATMAYDARRRRVILFGGWDNTANAGLELRDAWAWDGTTWSPLPAPDVGGSIAASMAYDPVRDEVVLHGGRPVDSGIAVEETWTFDGATWTQRAPATVPNTTGALAWDPAQARMLMFGGDVWSWDGVTWSQVSATDTGPMVWDPARERFTNTTSSWSGAALVPHGFSTPAPAARWKRSAAYDSRRGELVLVGGTTSSSPADDIDVGTGYVAETWLLGRTGWRSGAGMPLAARPGLAYDPIRDEMILFPSRERQTFRWDGSAWAIVAGSGRAEKYASLGWDPARAAIVRYGGAGDPLDIPDPPLDPTFDIRNEAMTWNGTAWTPLSAAGTPDHRYLHTMLTDWAAGTVIATGGLVASASCCTSSFALWELDATGWTATLETEHRPTYWDARGYDPHRRSLISHGGLLLDQQLVTTVSPDLHERAPGQPWTPLEPSGTPPASWGHALAYHALLRRMISIQDTGVYTFGYGPVREACWTGLDGDGDDLAGCADPDCWGYCTPSCPPGATCSASSAPRCGDGTCNPSLETSRLCPQDCGAPTPRCGDFICDAGEVCPGDCP